MLCICCVIIFQAPKNMNFHNPNLERYSEGDVVFDAQPNKCSKCNHHFKGGNSESKESTVIFLCLLQTSRHKKKKKKLYPILHAAKSVCEKYQYRCGSIAVHDIYSYSPTLLQYLPSFPFQLFTAIVDFERCCSHSSSSILPLFPFTVVLHIQ